VKFDLERAEDLLRKGVGRRDVGFRDGQLEAIRYVVEGRGRLLMVQKTGWGKSLVYFIATKLLRESRMGPCLLVSPLLSLMRNQVRAAERMGVRAETINSDNQTTWKTIETDLLQDSIDILLISPERFANEHFRAEVLGTIASRISLLVIDEAHCISDWGHDFRPHYRLIERIIGFLPPSLRLLATTATANDRVMTDLEDILGPGLETVRGTLDRTSLTLQTMSMPSQADRLAWLADHLEELSGSGIIYTLTVRDAEMVALWLRSRGFDVQAYTGKSGDAREGLEDDLLANRVKALVATTALGMGFDKPDLAFVIHFQTPGSVVAYYQQVGRAGRALDAAYGILLSGLEDTDITDYFSKSAFPTKDEVGHVLEALEEAPDGLSVPQLLACVNISKARVEKTIDLLGLESPAPVAKQGSKWQLTAFLLSDSFWERAERLTRLRFHEQRQMQEYVGLPFGEHMPYLIRALDGDATHVSRPSLPPVSEAVDQATVADAVHFLRRTNLSISPRKQWPAGGMPIYGIKGRIAPEKLACGGRCLSRWGDAGWGTLIRQGKYRDRVFSDKLVEACVQLVEQWNPQPTPTWVTCIPSLRHPDLVPDFARRVAQRLDLPFRKALVKTDNRPEQKTMANSVQQARNIDGSLEVVSSLILNEPVLLVDDMVDSRWTFTVGAWLLRENGSQEVWPLALADTGAGQ